VRVEGTGDIIWDGRVRFERWDGERWSEVVVVIAPANGATTEPTVLTPQEAVTHMVPGAGALGTGFQLITLPHVEPGRYRAVKTFSEPGTSDAEAKRFDVGVQFEVASGAAA
jgi:hypothetical protein